MSPGEGVNNEVAVRKGLNLAEHVKKGIEAVYNTFCRFPLPILLFAAFAALRIYRIEIPYERDIGKTLDRISAVIALGVPFTLCVDLLIERIRRNLGVILLAVCYAIELGILTLYYFFLFPSLDKVPVIRLLILTGSLGLMFLSIPYLPRKENFEVYITRILARATITGFYTVVLGAGVSAILFAVKSLLYDGMSWEFFAHTWILAWSIFAPIHFLYDFPQMEDAFGIEDYNKVLKILVLYIVLPVITVYTLVLYVYFGKIIITRVWPSGVVSYLVLSYTAASTAAIFLIAPFREQNRWARIFTNVFTKLIFPLLVMMFISISIRIGEFGFTENRYFIVAIGIWATLAMIFLNFNKGKYNIVLPVSLAVIAALTVIGPWSAFEISKGSQSRRFYNIVSKYGMIQNGKVVNNNSNVEDEDKREVSEILRYFNSSHKLSDLEYLPADFTFDKMEEVFGFKQVYRYSTGKNVYFNYAKYERAPLSITGYDLLFRLSSYKHAKNGGDAELVLESQSDIDIPQGNIKIAIDSGYVLTLWRNDTEIYRYHLLDYANMLYKKYGSDLGRGDTAPEELVVTEANDEVEVMFVFTNISGNTDTDSGKVELNHVEGDMFVKVK